VLDFGGTTAIDGNTFTGIADLTTAGGGLTSLTGPFTTTGSQTYGEAVVLAGNTALEATRFSFAASVDGARNLLLAATGGPVSFATDVGGTTPLGSLAIGRATAVTVGGRLVLDGSAPGALLTGLLIGTGVDNVTLVNAGNSITGFAGTGVLLEGGSRGSTFANFTVRNNGGNGFQLNPGDSTGTVIRDSVVSDNGFNGIWLNGSMTAVTVRNNTLVDNNNNGIVVSGPAIDIVVDGNTVRSSGLTGIRTEVVANLGTTNLRVTNNTVENNDENGIIMSGTTAATVQSNAVTGNRLQGVVLTLGATRTRVENNTISANGQFGVVVSGPQTIDNPILSNSIFRNTRGGISLVQGGNRLQVSPRLQSARISAGRVNIKGTISGQRGDVFRVQYFSNQRTDAANGRLVEGRTLLGFRDITLTGRTANINAAFAALGVPPQGWVSATATRLTAGTPTDTSQFAVGVKVAGGPAAPRQTQRVTVRAR